MRVVRALAALLGLIGPGCALFQPGAWTTGQQEWVEQKRNRKLAAIAWERELAEQTGAAFSADHAAGFHDGFCAYLYQGGNGEPPPLPPPRYRTVEQQGPRGYHAVEEWFTGYRHGARVAAESGLRQFIVGPTSVEDDYLLAPGAEPPGPLLRAAVLERPRALPVLPLHRSDPLLAELTPHSQAVWLQPPRPLTWKASDPRHDP